MNVLDEKQKKDKHYKYYVNYYEDLDELTIHDILKELPEWLANFLKEKNSQMRYKHKRESKNSFQFPTQTQTGYDKVLSRTHPV